MLPKKNRLSAREEFANVSIRGKYAAANGITIKFLPSEQIETRIGFSVGKKYSKKAVVRNRTRRVLQAACQALLPELQPGNNIVVMIRPDWQNVSFSEVSQTLNEVFRKANLFK